MENPMNPAPKTPLRPAFCAALLLCLAAAAQADDRRLITGYEEIPTVFFLFDTSGSMHWSSQCTQEDFDAGECDWLCPTGSCFTPANSDSPNSKFYQAKQAIYEVIEDIGDEIHVGFATFNQDELRLRRKHWLYEALEDGPTITGWGAYPKGRTAAATRCPATGTPSARAGPAPTARHRTTTTRSAATRPTRRISTIAGSASASPCGRRKRPT
jgi:hypothetical protein